LESQLAEKQGLLEDATKSLEILKNRLEQKVCGAVMSYHFALSMT
jgi:hypothetical protein